MTTIRTEDLLAAINFMIQANDCGKYLREVEAAVVSWARKQTRFSEDLDALNVLVQLGLRSRASLRKAVRLIEAKRALLPRQRRNDYQSRLMAARRARAAKVVELRELEAGRRLSGDERKVLIRDTQTRWQKERATAVLASGRTDFEGRNEVTQEFWEKIDRNLEINLRAAKQKYKVLTRA